MDFMDGKLANLEELLLLLHPSMGGLQIAIYKRLVLIVWV
jgi:hypothetical protein